MRTLAITQNITVDGSIEMLRNWFDPKSQGGVSDSDLLEELHREDREADGLLVGRRTFEDLRSYWPEQSTTPRVSPPISTRSTSTSSPRP